MRKMKLFGSTVIAVLMLGAMVSAAASAQELDMLPTGTAGSPLLFKVSSGAGALQTVGNSLIVKCAKDKGLGDFTSARLGTFDVTFEECLVNVPFIGLALCTGLDQTANSSKIFAEGEFHLRRLATEPLHILVAFLLKEVHFSCVLAGISKLFRVRGCALGLLTPINKKIKVGETANVSLKQKEGKNEFVESLNDAETESVKCLLETSEGTGAFAQSGEETQETIEGAEKGGVKVESEVMA